MRSIDFTGNDLNIQSKRLQMVDDIKQKIQRTKACIQTVAGELFYNTSIGLKYEEVLDISEKNISDDRKRIAIIEAIIKDDNVEKVENVVITTDRVSRKVEISVQLKYKSETSTTTIGGVKVG